MSDMSDSVAMSEISRLATEVRRSLELVGSRHHEGLREGLAVLRMTAALDSTTLLTRREGATVSRSTRSLVRDDLHQMLRILTTMPEAEQLGTDAFETAAMAADHIVRVIGLESANEEQPGPSEAHHGAHGDLVDLAAAYGKDAGFETWVMLTLYMFSAVVIGTGAGVACLGLGKAAETSTFRFSQFAAYGLVGVGLAGVGFATLWLAGRHRRAAREGRRLQRQLIGFDAWVAPIPDPLRAVLRATVAEQLFPRLVEDDEPWRRSGWPSADAAINLLASDREPRPDA